MTLGRVMVHACTVIIVHACNEKRKNPGTLFDVPILKPRYALRCPIIHSWMCVVSSVQRVLCSWSVAYSVCVCVCLFWSLAIHFWRNGGHADLDDSMHNWLALQKRKEPTNVGVPILDKVV